MMFGRLFVTTLLTIVIHQKCSLSYYIIDSDGGFGRRFDGIGGISGGSATSKLLVNYPEPQRSEILDFLFKPNFGASLQILKVEIGGDDQAAGGTESSHMHEEWDENYQRGYEWWLMTEAKKRNPAIKLYGLPWSFPGWIGRGTGNPYSYPDLTANYVVNWILGAKKHYNLDIDYIGIWNELAYSIDYVIILKKLLLQKDLTHVQIVVADGGWEVSDDILKHPDFAAVVDIIGVHYPGTTTTESALKTNKTLWSSEDYSTFNDNVGAGCWARILNQNYVNGNMTSTISWNLIASYYASLPLWNRQGLMTAQEPWTGHYTVNNPIWASAHTTQFTSVGWKYLRHGFGAYRLDRGGSVVTFGSPDGDDITIVIETMSHDNSICIRPDLPPYTVQPQTAQFILTGHLSGIDLLYVWRSSFSTGEMFKQVGTIKPDSGKFSLNLTADEIYTITTLSSGFKGSFEAPPPSKPFPLPYDDNFEAYAEFSEMNNFAAQYGVYEVRNSGDPIHGKVSRQVVLHYPIAWSSCGRNLNQTVNLGGNSEWTNVEIHADIFIPAVNGTDGAYIAARVGPGGCNVETFHGIYFAVYPHSKTFIVSSDLMQKRIIANGTCSSSLEFNKWFQLSLFIRNNRAYGALNSDFLFQAIVPADINKGFAAYGTTSLGIADFDNWFIGPISLPSVNDAF